MKILIADSGATKTDWAFIRDGEPVYERTIGLHPSYLDEEKVLRELKASLGDYHPDLILFYGAGCYSSAASGPVVNLIRALFGDVQLKINDDLTAVAHAYLENRDGTASVLGTGSASGYFKNGILISRVPSLGYITGDEGSAADIGKHILANALRNRFGRETADYLDSRLGTLEYGKVMEQLYHGKRPSFYLAEISKKVLHGDLPDEINEIVMNRFQAWTDAHLAAYPGFPDYYLVVTGGVANAHQSRLKTILHRNGVENYEIRSSVITALAENSRNLTYM